MAPDTNPKHAWALHKRREVASLLEGDEWTEWSKLTDHGKGRPNLTPAEEARVTELERKASKVYRKLLAEPVVFTPENDLGLYAKQIGRRMWERLAGQDYRGHRVTIRPPRPDERQHGYRVVMLDISGAALNGTRWATDAQAALDLAKAKIDAALDDSQP
ncbi:MAG TPA: hypothetical protein VFN61_16025 [Acidimicrobiales bacterium]|nr:hypothetical protein [Acidimicrobiales bacterium]